MTELIFTFIREITTNFIVLFLLSFLASEWCFLYFGKLLINKLYFRFEEKGVFSVLNGILITVFSIYIGDSAPVFMLIASPTLIAVELLVMSRDDLFSYLYYWVKILCNFICIYWLIVSMVGLISSKYVTGEIILPLTIFVSGWWCFFLSKSTRYPVKELKIMVHNRRIGLFHFVFLAVCVASLIFSTLVLAPILVNDLVDMGKIQSIFFVEMFLKAFAAEKKTEARTLILVDVDYFKKINDLLGHPAGDRALQTIAKILKEIFKINDIVGRLGGDEFCIFVDQVTDEEVIKKRLSQINERCRKDYPVNDEEVIHVSVSIGAVICTPFMKSYDDLYKYADLALYQTKRKGKDSYTLYKESEDMTTV